MKTIFNSSNVMILVCIICSACRKEEAKIEKSYISGLTETSAELNWTISPGEYSSSEIIVYPKSEGSTSDFEWSVINNQQEKMSLKIDRLKGLTSYTYKISLLKGNEVLSENEGEFKTTYSSDHVNIQTRDGYNLSGDIFYLSAREKKVPGVIMMHGLGETINPWPHSKAMDVLVENGYACMIFYFRGHKHTSPAFDHSLFKSEDGAYYLGCDMEAAIKKFREHKSVLPDSLGMMGGSMGAVGSAVGTVFPEVKASVALGPPIEPGQKPIQQIFPELANENYKCVSFIAGELDIQGEYNIANSTKQYYNMTEEPKELWIIENCNRHGSGLATYPGVLERMNNWFKLHLPSPYNLEN